MSSLSIDMREHGNGIVAPNVRDLDELSRILQPWLAKRIPEAADLAIGDLAYPQGAGMSHETILFEATWQERGDYRARGLVVRIKPTGNLVYQDDMFDAQFNVMRLLSEEGRVKIARPLWLEHDARILGAPFFVMEKRVGRVPISSPSYAQAGWLYDATAEERAVLWQDSVRQLASIQKTDPARAGFLATGAPGDGFAQEIDRWRRYLHWAASRRPLPFHAKVLDHLVATLPDNRPAGIVWGDARLGNMMFDADFRVSAVMDWEQPSLGGALHDLGWWLFSEELRTSGIGLRPLSGMGERADTVALWEEVSGCSAADLDWYVAFAAFKMACLSAKMSQDRDTSAKGPELHNTLINRLIAEMLGWPSPGAAV